MAFLIRTIDYTAAGREIVREHPVDQASLSLGRASENDIHLPDLAVEQQHARITQKPDGKLAVEALSSLGFVIDGRQADAATIDPGEGAELAIGSSLLTIAKDEGDAIGITIRKAEKDAASGDALSGFALASALPSKRFMSWAFTLVILVALLAIPIYSHLTRERVEPDADRPGQVTLDSAWSTGKLSLAHHGLEDNCEACHVDAFVSVRDDTCLACHQELGDHAPAPRLADGRAPHSFGDDLQWQVASMFGKEGPGACTTCHTEHEGPTRMEPASQQFCADCHDTLDTRLMDTSLGNASDFGLKHPQFQPTFFTALNQDQPVRVSLDNDPEEMSGLKFPHDVHLDKTGGVARMAMRLGRGNGYGGPLECSSCHTEDANRIGFQPVEMESACESCHSLVFDRVGGVFRRLPHGDVEQMRANLLAMDRTPRRPIVTGRSRPGQFARGSQYYANFGRPLPSLVGVDRALAPGGVCGECHLPGTTNGRPDVIPVNLPDRFMLHGYFDHAAHEQEECSTCHAAETSESATDLLLPDLAICRDCHMGETAIESDVPSSCAMCHSYHVPTGPAPLDHPSDRTNMAALTNRRGP